MRWVGWAVMNKKVKELGFSRMPKEELKALKAALQPEPVPIARGGPAILHCHWLSLIVIP
jgi:hypothetical protein